MGNEVSLEIPRVHVQACIHQGMEDNVGKRRDKEQEFIVLMLVVCLFIPHISCLLSVGFFLLIAFFGLDITHGILHEEIIHSTSTQQKGDVF